MRPGDARQGAVKSSGSHCRREPPEEGYTGELGQCSSLLKRKPDLNLLPGCGEEGEGFQDRKACVQAKTELKWEKSCVCDPPGVGRSMNRCSPPCKGILYLPRDIEK